MKRCPRCNCEQFIVTAHVVQEWLVDKNGMFEEINDDCICVTHDPDDEDIWQCSQCGYDATGKEFNLEE